MKEVTAQLNPSPSARPHNGPPVPAHPARGTRAPGKRPARKIGGVPSFAPSNIRLVQRGKLLCVSDVALILPPFGRLALLDVRFVDDANGPHCLPPASVWFDEETGLRRYKPLVNFPTHWLPALNAAVGAAFDDARQATDANGANGANAPTATPAKGAA